MAKNYESKTINNKTVMPNFLFLISLPSFFTPTRSSVSSPAVITAKKKETNLKEYANNQTIENTLSYRKKCSRRALFLGKRDTVSTPGAGLKFPSPKSWISSPTIPRSLFSSTDSGTSTSDSELLLATEIKNNNKKNPQNRFKIGSPKLKAS